MSSVLLLNPPGLDPRSPRLSLPTLAAALRPCGADVSLVDLDLEGLLWLLRPESLQRAARAHAGQAASGATRLALLAERLGEAVPSALSVLRDASAFFDPWALSAARETVLDGLDLVSAAAPRGVRYGLEPLRYEVDGVDPTRLADLLRVSTDRAANLFADHWDERLEPLLARGFDAVGISITARFQMVPALMLARWLKRRGQFVVLGGALLPRLAPRLAGLPEFFEAFADGVVVGDGETALAELLEQLAGARDWASVPNLLYLAGGQVRRTPDRYEDVSRLPTPDFSGLPLDAYLSPARVLPLVASRGCYWGHCRFCEIPYNQQVSAHPHRRRPVERLVHDLVSLADRHACRHFLLGDEAVPPRTFEELARGLEAAGRTDLRFVAYARFEPGLTPALCRRLAGAGLRHVLLGLESGCQETLDRMRKGTRVEHARPVLDALAGAGLRFGVFALLGLPQETEAQARQTGDFFERHREVFDAPGRHFDIRPLELQWVSPFMGDAAALGLDYDPALVSGEFPYGVGRAWENRQGLGQADVDALLAEFRERFDRSLGRYHSWPAILWPAWEEWALLYADHYWERPFPFRAALPENGGEAVRLEWSPALAVTGAAGGLALASRRAVRILRPASVEALAGAGPARPDELLRRLAGEQAGRPEVLGRVRALVNGLARDGLLQIRLVPAEAPRAQAGAGAS